MIARPGTGQARGKRTWELPQRVDGGRFRSYSLMMGLPSRSSEEKLRNLASAIDGLESKTTPPVAPAKTMPPPTPELGPKTRLAVRVMAWAFRLFWGLWLALAVAAAPPRQVSDLIAVPLSGLIVWMIFQFHKATLIAAVRKLSSVR